MGKRKPKAKRVEVRLSDLFAERLAMVCAAHELPAATVLRILISEEAKRLAAGGKP